MLCIIRLGHIPSGINMYDSIMLCIMYCNAAAASDLGTIAITHSQYSNTQ